MKNNTITIRCAYCNWYGTWTQRLWHRIVKTIFTRHKLRQCRMKCILLKKETEERTANCRYFYPNVRKGFITKKNFTIGKAK